MAIVAVLPAAGTAATVVSVAPGFRAQRSSPARVQSAAKVQYWDMDAAMKAESLTYEAQAFAFVLEGLLNSVGGPPKIMFNAGFLDFDWPGADQYWRTQLEGRCAFHLPPTTSFRLYPHPHVHTPPRPLAPAASYPLTRTAVGGLTM